MRETHAKHNESLCEFLASDGRWDDWVVTTAFYSAIHFVEHKLFPMKEDSVKYEAFEVYYEDTKEKYQQSPHKRRKQLVQDKIEHAYEGYAFLMKEARVARYKNYQIAKKIADLAREHLKTVKYHCKKK